MVRPTGNLVRTSRDRQDLVIQDRYPAQARYPVPVDPVPVDPVPVDPVPADPFPAPAEPSLAPADPGSSVRVRQRASRRSRLGSSPAVHSLATKDICRRSRRPVRTGPVRTGLARSHRVSSRLATLRLVTVRPATPHPATLCLVTVGLVTVRLVTVRLARSSRQRGTGHIPVGPRPGSSGLLTSSTGSLRSVLALQRLA